MQVESTGIELFAPVRVEVDPRKKSQSQVIMQELVKGSQPRPRTQDCSKQLQGKCCVLQEQVILSHGSESIRT